MEKAAAQKDIVDTAVAAGSFNTLVAAVQAAGLVETLKGKGPFTVFAPTDEAFAKIPKATLDALLKDKKNLTAVLTYHVVQGNVTSSDLKNGMSVKTVEGQNLSIDTTNGVMVNNAKVVKANIMATNGVIHVIDTVLMPPTATSKAAPTNTPGFEAAFSVAGLLAIAFIALKRRS
jgi:PGF-CTERM protein